MNLTVSPTRAGVYHRLRHYLHEKPWLYKITRTIRFTVLVGPGRQILIALCRAMRPNPAIVPAGETSIPSVNTSDLAAKLEEAGCATCGTLPAQQVDEIAALATPMKRGTIVNPHEKWETVRRVVYDPTFIDIARRYFGTEPIVYGSGMWWSVPDAPRERVTATAHATRFHFDVADCKSLAVFIYLTDVPDETFGAHVVIEGTHRKKTFSQLLNVYLDDDEARSRFGDRIKAVFGPRGLVFIEEQTLFHKGIAALKPRLVLAFNYTIRRKPKRGGWTS